MYTYIQYTYIYGYLCTVHGIYLLLAEILEPAKELYYQHTILYMCDDVLPPLSCYILTQAYINADTQRPSVESRLLPLVLLLVSTLISIPPLTLCYRPRVHLSSAVNMIYVTI